MGDAVWRGSSAMPSITQETEIDDGEVVWFASEGMKVRPHRCRAVDGVVFLAKQPGQPVGELLVVLDNEGASGSGSFRWSNLHGRTGRNVNPLTRPDGRRPRVRLGAFEAEVPMLREAISPGGSRNEVSVKTGCTYCKEQQIHPLQSSGRRGRTCARRCTRSQSLRMRGSRSPIETSNADQAIPILERNQNIQDHFHRHPICPARWMDWLARRFGVAGRRSRSF